MAAFVPAPLLRRVRRKPHVSPVFRPQTIRACDGGNLVAHESIEDSRQEQRAEIQQDTRKETRQAVFVDPTRPEKLIFSPSLNEFAEQRAAGLIAPFVPSDDCEWGDAWTLSVMPKRALELRNQYSRVGILIEKNFCDFVPAKGAEEIFAQASLEDLSRAKARALYAATGLPAIAETHDLSIDAPESGSNINKTLQQGYYTRNVEEEADAMIDRVRPISDENRATRFCSVVSYFDGEIEITTHGSVTVAMVFSAARYCTIAVAAALDDLYKSLTRKLNLKLYNPEMERAHVTAENIEKSNKLVGASMLRERLLREGQLLEDGIVKVSSFLNHLVDVDLMEECGLELAERLRSTMPNKVLTVESTGLIPALPTAKRLGIPLLFARKSRPITISDSFQATYRSATKGVSSELVVSCEYLQAGDRVLIIDDFLAGGSTAEALFKLAKMAQAKIVGVGVLIEKMSSGGRAFLSGYSVPVESLAKIDIADAQTSHPRLTVVEEEQWVDKASAEIAKENLEREEQRKSIEESSNILDSDLDGDDIIDDGVVNLDDSDDLDQDDFDMIQDNLIRATRR